MFTYKRPQNLKFPHIYCKFNAKNKNSDEIVEYRVQDLPEERFDETLDLFIDHFLPDEELNICRGLLKTKDAVQEHRDMWAKLLIPRLSIGCFRCDELVGVNLLIVHSKNDLMKKFNVS